MLENGKGVEKHPCMGRIYYKEAADNGYNLRMYNYDRMLRHSSTFDKIGSIIYYLRGSGQWL